MEDSPRNRIGKTLLGEVLEVGPGSNPFPTAPDARVIYADRSVPGGRDVNWPELVGAPWGPKAHLNVDLDLTGLGPVADRSLDAVVASHMIEHVANPLYALAEFHRVLRPGGKLVLIVPDRKLTFDWVRQPTPFSHVLSEFRQGVREVDDAHIVEFCRSIYMQPSIHPALVRGWHDPRHLDADRIALHRRRSIHVHCWTPEEFAAMIAGALAEGLMGWKLADLYFVDDLPNSKGDEFGLVLVRTESSDAPIARCRAFIEDWTRCALDHSKCQPVRVARFAKALQRDLGRNPELRAAIARPAGMLAERGISTRVEGRDADTLKLLKLRLKRFVRDMPLVRLFG